MKYFLYFLLTLLILFLLKCLYYYLWLINFANEPTSVTYFLKAEKSVILDKIFNNKIKGFEFIQDKTNMYIDDSSYYKDAKVVSIKNNKAELNIEIRTFNIINEFGGNNIVEPGIKTELLLYGKTNIPLPNMGYFEKKHYIKQFESEFLPQLDSSFKSSD